MVSNQTYHNEHMFIFFAKLPLCGNTSLIYDVSKVSDWFGLEIITISSKKGLKKSRICHVSNCEIL